MIPCQLAVAVPIARRMRAADSTRKCGVKQGRTQGPRRVNRRSGSKSVNRTGKGLPRSRQRSRSTWSSGGSRGQHVRSVAFLRAVAIAFAGAVSAASDVHTNTQTNAAAERNAARGNPLLELLEFEIQVLHIGSPPFALG